tara:strand:- start:164 stop:391 length:228 start_codon:yes stop_codon:yes gene_type:complete
LDNLELKELKLLLEQFLKVKRYNNLKPYLEILYILQLHHLLHHIHVHHLLHLLLLNNLLELMDLLLLIHKKFQVL